MVHCGGGRGRGEEWRCESRSDTSQKLGRAHVYNSCFGASVSDFHILYSCYKIYPLDILETFWPSCRPFIDVPCNCCSPVHHLFGPATERMAIRKRATCHYVDGRQELHSPSWPARSLKSLENFEQETLQKYPSPSSPSFRTLCKTSST